MSLPKSIVNNLNAYIGSNNIDDFVAKSLKEFGNCKTKCHTWTSEETKVTLIFKIPIWLSSIIWIYCLIHRISKSDFVISALAFYIANLWEEDMLLEEATLEEILL